MRTLSGLLAGLFVALIPSAVGATTAGGDRSSVPMVSPTNHISWEQSQGPRGAKIHAIGYEPVNSSLYAATGQGLYAYYAAAWYTLSAAGSAISSLSITGGSEILAASKNQVFVYTPGPVVPHPGTLTPVGGVVTGGSIQAVARGASGTLYVGMSTGLHKWTGSAWELIAGITGSVWSIISRSDGDLIIGTDNTGVYEFDESSTFAIQICSEPLPALALDPTDGMTIYGANPKVNPGIYEITAGCVAVHPEVSSIYFSSITVTTAGDIFAVGPDQIYGSISGGTFSPYTESRFAYAPQAYHSIASNGSEIFAAINSGVYRSLPPYDGWSRPTVPWIQTEATTLWTDGDLARSFAGLSTGEIFFTDDNGDNWTLGNYSKAIPILGGAVVGFAQYDNSTPSIHRIFAARMDAGVYYSGNGGAAWASFNESPLGGNVLSVAVYQPYQSGSFYGRVFAGTNDGLFYSHAYDENDPPDADWTQVSDPEFPGGTEVLGLMSTPSNRVIAGTGDALLYSDDGGITWNNFPTFPGLGGQVMGVDDAGVLYVFAAQGDELYRSDDDGATWIDLQTPSDGITDANGVTALNISGSGQIFISDMDGNIYVSPDHGTTWHRVVTGLPPTQPVQGLCPTNDGRMLAGVAGYGVFRTVGEAITCIPFPTTDMVGWWSGDLHAYDISGKNNNGSLNGAMVYSDGIVNVPRVDQAFVFDGVNDFVEVPHDASLDFGTGDFSADFWIRTTANIDVQVLLDKRAAIGEFGYEIFLYNGRPGVQLADGAGGLAYTNYNSLIPIADNSWHHVAITVDRDDPSGLKFYVDGILEEIQDPTGRQNTLANSNPLYIGTESFTSLRFFPGMLDEIELFDRILTPDEILQIYNAGGSGKCKTDCPPDNPYSYQKSYKQGWNLISLSATVVDATKSVLFPDATSLAFAWCPDPQNSYCTDVILDKCRGYWLKFPSPVALDITGSLLCNLTCEVGKGWNMLGMISWDVDPSLVESDPPGIIESDFFLYQNGYFPVPSVDYPLLVPGRGYWLKTNAAGTLYFPTKYLKASPVESPDRYAGLNILTIADAAGNTQRLYFGMESPGMDSPDRFAMPPLPPPDAFDVRFASGRFVETYAPAVKGLTSYPISIQSAAYPIVISVDSPDPSADDMWIVVRGEGASLRRMPITEGRGITIEDPGTTLITLAIGDESGIPTAFTLHQNHPNPFNPSTDILFDLPVDAIVTIGIFDMLGRQVALLADNQRFDAGRQRVKFVADGNASGLYFYRIRATSGSGSYAETKKMLLVR